MLNEDGLIPGWRSGLERRDKLEAWHVLGLSVTPGSPSG